jgi:hypothetical protein
MNIKTKESLVIEPVKESFRDYIKLKDLLIEKEGINWWNSHQEMSGDTIFCLFEAWKFLSRVKPEMMEQSPHTFLSAFNPGVPQKDIDSLTAGELILQDGSLIHLLIQSANKCYWYAATNDGNLYKIEIKPE